MRGMGEREKMMDKRLRNNGEAFYVPPPLLET